MIEEHHVTLDQLMEERQKIITERDQRIRDTVRNISIAYANAIAPLEHLIKMAGGEIISDVPMQLDVKLPEEV